MNNVLLGKTIKAMYKLSGKTLTQLSDETGLTIDTINNLFYARIQKPSLDSVNTLVGAMGFSLQQLLDFLDAHSELSESCDVTELFAGEVCTAEETEPTVKPAKPPVADTKENLCTEIELLNAEHERQLDRFRATHQRYLERLEEQHRQQIEQMAAHNQQMEQHYHHSVNELKTMHTQEMERLEKENVRMRRTQRGLFAALFVETGLILLLFILDMINRSIGWMR